MPETDTAINEQKTAPAEPQATTEAPAPVVQDQTPPAAAEAASDENPAESLDGENGVLGDVQLSGPEEPLQESFTDESKTAEGMRGMRWSIIRSLVASVLAIKSSGADVAVKSLVTERLFLGDESNPLIPRLTEILEAIAVTPEIGSTPADVRAAWIGVARKVLTLARETFASLPGMDQDENAVLHALANSTASPGIIADLACQVDSTTYFELTPKLLGNVLNGNQSRELQVIGVAPERIIPLVNIVVDSAKILAIPTK